MKNIKLVAKIMLLVLLLTSAFSFVGCMGGKSRNMRFFNSHDEMLKFIEKYNSKNDGFVYTFMSFDFKNNNSVKPYTYGLETIWTNRISLITNERKYVDIYDKDHSKGNFFKSEIVFHIDELSVQVRCSHYTREDYNFYQDDEMLIEYSKNYSFIELDNDNTKMLEIYSDYNDFLSDFADVRSRNQETFEYEKYYNYLNQCYIKINGKNEVKVEILSDDELSEEQLNSIERLLLDNIVIINTEG